MIRNDSRRANHSYLVVPEKVDFKSQFRGYKTVDKIESVFAIEN